MGISVDSAFTKWEKVTKTLFRPRIDSVFRGDLEEEFPDDDKYYELQLDCDILAYMNDFRDPYYDQWRFDWHLEKSHKFLDKVEELNVSPLRDWLLKQRGKMIHYDYNTYLASTSLEECERKIWVGSNSLPIREDGGLLFDAVLNIKHLYEIDLGPSLISRDFLDGYLEKEGAEIDKQLTGDLIPLALEAEKKLKTLLKKHDDPYFEERKERIKIVLDLMKQGAKLVYSV